MEPNPEAPLPSLSDRSAAGPHDDAELILAYQAGDQSAFASLYDRHCPAMLGLAFRFLKDRRDAEDLIHDVFLQVCKAARSYDPARGSVRAWLLMRVRSRAIDRMRRIERAKKHVFAAGLVQRSPLEVDIDACRAIDGSAATAALEQLSPPLRLVARLVYLEGWTCDEVATRHALPLGTVKSRLAAAKSRLRSKLCCGEGSK